MRIKSFGKTDTGLTRKGNEDYFLIKEDKLLFLLSDGIGGSRAGEVASQLSCKYFGKYFNKNPVTRFTGRPQHTPVCIEVPPILALQRLGRDDPQGLRGGSASLSYMWWLLGWGHSSVILQN